MTLPLALPIIAPDAPPPTPDAPPPTCDGPLRDLTADDLPALLTAFYAEVAGDQLLAPYFAALDMTRHIPRIADFWATVLFHAGRYQGNAFRPHLALPGLDTAHFTRWLAALERTLDARHRGEGAERMKAVGHRIAYSMQLRLGVPPCLPYAPVVRARDATVDDTAF